jgi:hypothetical protein
MSDEDLASKVNAETPWWAKALDPKSAVYLAAGIVGVPSLMALGAGYFIAQSVTRQLRALDQYNQSELYQINGISNEEKRNFEVVFKFIEDDLRVQFVTCVNTSKDDTERKACLTAETREQEYGMKLKPSRRNFPSNGP